ncbi:hypothetical protein ACTPOK_04145 [Streptomyces inhibens]|uniref:hypothetical protein n=1 Tax=Streptomyces inhibens TaxID=2293571 RepID=UPI00402AAD4F
MSHEAILRGLGMSARTGSVVPAEGGEAFADDLAAAAVAAGLDLQEQSGAADLALGFGEAAIEIRLERLQDAVGAAVAGGGQQLVEVGVAEAAHGLAVKVQTAGNAAISFWLYSGVDPAECARRAGQSIKVLFRRYAKFLDGVREQANRLIEQSMQEWDRVSQGAEPAG